MMEYTDQQADNLVRELSGPASSQQIVQAIVDYFGLENPIIVEYGYGPHYNIWPYFLDVKDGYIWVTDHGETAGDAMIRKTKTIYSRTCSSQVEELLTFLTGK